MSAKYATNAPPQSRLIWFLVALLAACTAVLILLTGCGFFASYWWRFEQLCHFRVQYFWLLATAAAILLACGRRRLATAAAIAALVNLALIVPIYLPSGDKSAQGSPVRLIAFNVLGSNRRYDEVHEFLRGEQADIVLLMEVQPHWAQQFDGLRDLYPHQHVVSRRDNFGIALLSKVAWRDVQTAEFGSAEVPSVVATFDNDGVLWTLVGTHPLPPGSSRAAAARNEQLAAIGDFVQGRTGPVVVAGDLNTTEHSPYFTRLLQTSGLRDSRQGFGVQASWSPRLPILELPLDHCLVSHEWHVSNRRVGPNLGSDHRPVKVQLHLAKNGNR